MTLGHTCFRWLVTQGKPPQHWQDETIMFEAHELMTGKERAQIRSRSTIPSKVEQQHMCKTCKTCKTCNMVIASSPVPSRLGPFGVQVNEQRIRECVPNTIPVPCYKLSPGLDHVMLDDRWQVRRQKIRPSYRR